MASIAHLDGFTISYDGRSVVTVTRQNVPERDFDGMVSRAYSLANSFPRSKPGSSWGCDDIGYHAQQRIGVVQVHSSGVGPRKFTARARELGVTR